MVTAASMCLLLLTGCVPGQSIDSLAKQPEAALTYPGSTDVRINHDRGRVQFGLDGGDVAITGICGKTTHQQREVIAFYSHALAANGWTQTRDNPGVNTEAGLLAHAVQWDKTKLHLTYFIKVWTEGETTKYDTQLQSLL
ncbi:hypothetical protein [Cryobacterium zhongshanensis]|uniref:Uncharacterized protein n=1 Tax=Cryobacterium zhongshanensis TaxID=2928153 RepID=A0AA41QZ07_9MICO|nr:hypothetical protein [Cryobacterium zhongshanensis]MCI4658516.1 hypothetical protein [Cryobacterium zhongshanensis]